MVPKRCETEGMGLLYVPSGATLPYLLQQPNLAPGSLFPLPPSLHEGLDPGCRDMQACQEHAGVAGCVQPAACAPVQQGVARHAHVVEPELPIVHAVQAGL